MVSYFGERDIQQASIEPIDRLCNICVESSGCNLLSGRQLERNSGKIPRASPSSLSSYQVTSLLLVVVINQTPCGSKSMHCYCSSEPLGILQPGNQVKLQRSGSRYCVRGWLGCEDHWRHRQHKNVPSRYYCRRCYLAGFDGRSMSLLNVPRAQVIGKSVLRTYENGLLKDKNLIFFCVLTTMSIH
jgi:hypothetical protein